jgi:hypothetical protein
VTANHSNGHDGDPCTDVWHCHFLLQVLHSAMCVCQAALQPQPSPQCAKSAPAVPSRTSTAPRSAQLAMPGPTRTRAHQQSAKCAQWEPSTQRRGLSQPKHASKYREVNLQPIWLVLQKKGVAGRGNQGVLVGAAANTRTSSCTRQAATALRVPHNFSGILAPVFCSWHVCILLQLVGWLISTTTCTARCIVVCDWY